MAKASVASLTLLMLVLAKVSTTTDGIFKVQSILIHSFAKE